MNTEDLLLTNQNTQIDDLDILVGRSNEIIIHPNGCNFILSSHRNIFFVLMLDSEYDDPLDNTKNRMYVTGRSIETCNVYLKDKNNTRISKRLASNRDKLFMEIGGGFSELITNEAHRRFMKGCQRPILIDPFDYTGLLSTLNTLRKNNININIATCSEPINIDVLINRLNIILNPEFTNLIPMVYSRESNLPKDVIDLISFYKGIHTIVDNHAALLYNSLEDQKGIAQSLRKLLNTENGELIFPGSNLLASF